MYPTRRIKQPSNVTMQDLLFLNTVGLQKKSYGRVRRSEPIIGLTGRQ